MLKTDYGKRYKYRLMWSNEVKQVRNTTLKPKYIDKISVKVNEFSVKEYIIHDFDSERKQWLTVTPIKENIGEYSIPDKSKTAYYIFDREV